MNSHEAQINSYKKVRNTLKEIAEVAEGSDKEAYEHAAMLVDYEIRYLEAYESTSEMDLDYSSEAF